MDRDDGRHRYELAVEQSHQNFFQYHVGRYVQNWCREFGSAAGDFARLGVNFLWNFGLIGSLLREEVTGLVQEIRDFPTTTLYMWRSGEFFLPFRNLQSFLSLVKGMKKDFLVNFNYSMKKASQSYHSSWSCPCRAYCVGVSLLSMFTLYHYQIRPWRRHDNKTEINCLHKTVIITGASSGIGYRLAYEFAKRGAFVIITSPDMVKARKARLDLSRKLIRYMDHSRRRVIEQAGVRYYDQLQIPKKYNILFLLQNIVEVELNLACTASIYSFSRKLQGMSPDGIDILINNAGINVPPEEMVVTNQGKEVHFAVNYFGHFVITNLLVGLLAKRKGARIINVTCKGAAEKGLIDFSEFVEPYLEDEGLPFLPAQDGYANSKLAQYLFNRHLSKELQQSGINNVTTYCVCPGLTATNLNRYLKASKFMRTWNSYARAFYKKPWHAVQGILYCALSPLCSHESGFFYENCGKSELKTQHINQDKDAKELWNASMKLMLVGHNSMLKLTEQMHILSHENIFQLSTNLFLHRRDVMTHLLLMEEKDAFKTKHKKHVDERGDARDDFTYFWNGFYLTGGENSGLIERWVLNNAHPGFKELQKEYDIWFECTGSSHFHPKSNGKIAPLQYMACMTEKLNQDDVEELEKLYESDTEPDEAIETKPRFYDEYISMDEFL